MPYWLLRDIHLKWKCGEVMRSCTFIGHKDCPQEIKEKLCETVEDLIVNSDVRRFYVGTHGSFDRLVYKVLCDFESKYEIEIIVVLSYLYHKKMFIMI